MKLKKSLSILCAAAIAIIITSCASTKGAGMNTTSARINTGDEHYTFKLDDGVVRTKVTFRNHFGIELAGDLYTPKNAPAEGNAAIAVCGPFGAVKEQASGLYAAEMARRRFITLAFDPSFTGESGGEPRYMNSPDINTEDFQSAVDFLSTRNNIDPEKIGIIGICGWGGMALNTAAIDTRIKATAVITMYDMTRIAGNGYFDESDNEEARYQARKALNEQRTKDFAAGDYPTGGGLPDARPEGDTFFSQYWDYYKTERGYHPRSLNSNMGWAKSAGSSLLNDKLLAYSNEIRNAVLIIHGEKAHSRYMGETAYNNMIKGNKFTDNKELMIIPGATHCDLYDGGNGNFIPWEKLEKLFLNM